MVAKRALGVLLSLSAVIGFIYAKHVDSELLDQAVGAANQHADAADWRLSNFDLRQRTLEFTSELRAYAAG